MLVFIVYMLLGCGAGFIAGLFGVGGGLIIVPCLIFMFEYTGIAESVATHLAIGTSLMTITITSFSSTRAHHQKHAVDWSVFTTLSWSLVLGAMIGAVLLAHLSATFLQYFVGVFAFYIALRMYLASQHKPAVALQQKGSSDREVDALVQTRTVEDTPPLLVSSTGIIIGGVSSLIGIGGGSLMVPFLTWRGYPVQKAVGTSAACGFPIAIAASCIMVWQGVGLEHLPEYSSGYVYWPAFIGIVTTSAVTAKYGAAIAHRLDERQLQQSFAILLTLIACKLIFL